ncbi:hypothetical protein EV421DRAFT_2000960 [Armillaria borealis]|uniref:NodB homology domain-containing protein n=1 Tax=Armillaria borealis TaxID=47425 RepID=A0AA39MFY3_9AGAR|nr:hypothetical protein EV421DRAFT_2000960 [Armillaria borealis]
MLDVKGVKGTFFINGNNYGCIYRDTERVVLQNTYSRAIRPPHEHTWAHKDLAMLTTDQVESEFTLTDTALEKILGVKVAFMRPPYGSYNDGDEPPGSVRSEFADFMH